MPEGRFARGGDTAAPEAAGQVAEEEGEGDNPGSFERRAGGALHEHGRGQSPDPEAGDVRSGGGGRSGAGHRAVFLDPNSAGEAVRYGGGSVPTRSLGLLQRSSGGRTRSFPARESFGDSLRGARNETDDAVQDERRHRQLGIQRNVRGDSSIFPCSGFASPRRLSVRPGELEDCMGIPLIASSDSFAL